MARSRTFEALGCSAILAAAAKLLPLQRFKWRHGKLIACPGSTPWPSFTNGSIR